METTPNLTALEVQVLHNIIRSEFQDSNAAADIINTPIWSWSATEEDKQLAGALGSLVKKKLAGCTGVRGAEATCWITSEGWEALQEAIK